VAVALEGLAVPVVLVPVPLRSISKSLPKEVLYQTYDVVFAFPEPVMVVAEGEPVLDADEEVIAA